MSMKTAKLAALLSDFERPRPRPLRRQETAWRRMTASTRLPMADGQGCWRELGMEYEPKVLLLHGWGGDASLYAPLAAALSGTGWHVIIPDLLGHGDACATPFGYAAQLQWLNVIERRFGPFDLIVAHSAGALLVEVARAQGALLVDARISLAAPLTLITLFQRYLWQTREQGFTAESLAAAYLDAQRLPLTLLDPKPRTSGDKLLICHGREDGVIAVQEAKKLAAKHPRSTLWLPADTGHMGLVQHPELAERVARFYPLSGGR
ncbi:alpha/beta fold hydrolase [Lonsdalea quercina]|uniref:alpha/beta fold hydrolase n=1 Tax=Lonsdalea quercina TaxID=71657 RepID=UPI003974EE6C